MNRFRDSVSFGLSIFDSVELDELKYYLSLSSEQWEEVSVQSGYELRFQSHAFTIEFQLHL